MRDNVLDNIISLLVVNYAGMVLKSGHFLITIFSLRGWNFHDCYHCAVVAMNLKQFWLQRTKIVIVSTVNFGSSTENTIQIMHAIQCLKIAWVHTGRMVIVGSKRLIQKGALQTQLTEQGALDHFINPNQFIYALISAALKYYRFSWWRGVK